MTVADIKPISIIAIPDTKKSNSTWAPVFSRLLNRWIPPFIQTIISDHHLVQLALLIQKRLIESQSLQLNPLDTGYLTVITQEFQLLYAEAHHGNYLVDISQATCSSILELLSDALKDQRDTLFQTLAALFGYRFPYAFAESGVSPRIMQLYPKVVELKNCFIKAITLKAVAAVLLMAEEKAVVSDDALEEVKGMAVDTRHLLLCELLENNMEVYKQISTGEYDGVGIIEALTAAELLVEEKLGLFWWLKESRESEVPCCDRNAVQKAILDETEVIAQVWALKKILEM
ncbi:hypothetical protein BZA77DRAFT_360480 [Pyronema omphalodes]|nr:hypothetical protein BZA77DRAFT_360480 [Pyronema omphalodes]